MIFIPILLVYQENVLVPQTGRQQITFALQLFTLHTFVLQYYIEGVRIRGNSVRLPLVVPDIPTVLCLYPVDMAKG